jgi:hypothetical protein
VPGQFALWPVTQQALAYLTNERKRIPAAAKKSPLLLPTGRGEPYTAQHLANMWNRLLDRIQQDQEQRDFRRLGFKFIRKTAAQLVRGVSDGETTATFLCHRQAVATDNLADAYTRRDFSKVDQALGAVNAMLSPTMFNIVPEPFSQRRRLKGYAPAKRISKATPASVTATAR